MSRPKIKPDVYEIRNFDGFSVIISTNTMDEHPKVVYIRGKSRFTPCEKKKTYEEDIRAIKAEFEEFSKRLISGSESYSKNHILNITVSEKSINYNKNSHLHYDVFLLPVRKMTLSENRPLLERLSRRMDEKLLELYDKRGMRTCK